MKTGVKGIECIKSFEGCKLNAYKCPAGVWTIGYGHTGVDVYSGLVITQQRANELLALDLEKFEKEIEKLSLNINQNQFDALVSFSFNLGIGSLKKSTLLKKIKANPLDQSIRGEFMKWINAGGKKLDGLVKRRSYEADIYFS